MASLTGGKDPTTFTSMTHDFLIAKTLSGIKRSPQLLRNLVSKDRRVRRRAELRLAKLVGPDIDAWTAKLPLWSDPWTG